MTTVFFHEDDYCQVELQPIENADFIQQQLNEIHNFSVAHQTENGGWTDMYIRSEPETTLDTKTITLTAFDELMCQVAPKFDKVLTGYSSYREECPNVVGYGTDVVKVFAEHKDGLIQAIWLDYYLETDEIVQTVYQYVKAITDKFDLLFVDWAWGYAVHVKNSANFLDLLQQQANEFQERLKNSDFF